MSDLLASGVEWLRTQRKAYLSETIVYAQDGDTVSVVATKAETRFETDTGDGVLLTGRQVDWLVDAADLATGLGAGMQPLPGDRIQAGTGAAAIQYTVVQIGGEAPWRWHDRQQKTYRIHTIETAQGAL
jgi:hypothetical protein